MWHIGSFYTYIHIFHILFLFLKRNHIPLAHCIPTTEFFTRVLTHPISVLSLFILFFACLGSPFSRTDCVVLNFLCLVFLGNFFTIRNPTKAENYRIMKKIKEKKKQRRRTKRSLPQGKVLSPRCQLPEGKRIREQKGIERGKKDREEKSIVRIPMMILVQPQFEEGHSDGALTLRLRIVDGSTYPSPSLLLPP